LVITEKRAEELIAAVRSLEAADNIAELTALLAPG